MFERGYEYLRPYLEQPYAGSVLGTKRMVASPWYEEKKIFEERYKKNAGESFA